MSDRALTLARADSFHVPAIVADVGPEAAKRFFEFFTVPIRNKNTRIAYYQAIGQFLAWCGCQPNLRSGHSGLVAYRIARILWLYLGERRRYSDRIAPDPQ